MAPTPQRATRLARRPWARTSSTGRTERTSRSTVSPITALAAATRRAVERLRWPPTRRALLRRLLVLTASAVLATGIALQHHSARQLEKRWELTPVAVATAVVAPGEPLDESNVALRPMPAGMVPRGALESSPVGEISATGLVEGEILLRDRLVDDASPRAPAGTASIRLEPVAPAPALEPGDSVDVLAFGAGAASLPDPGLEPPGEGGAMVVARGAQVLVPPEGEDHSLTVAVRSQDVTATAAAALGAGVVVVLRGG